MPEPDPLGHIAGQVTVATYRQLEAAKQLSQPAAAIALNLARQLDAGGHTASGAAALARELRATLDAALRAAPTQNDPLDELVRARAERMARQSGA